MAMIKCKECGNEVSNKAKTCPNCGAKIKRRSSRLQILFLFFIISFALLSIFSSFDNIRNPAPAKAQSTTPPEKAQASEVHKLEADAYFAKSVNSIKIRGKTIKMYDTADQVFSVLDKGDMVNQTVSKDPTNPNSLMVKKNYNVKGKKFTIWFTRMQDSGPYKVTIIIPD